MASLSREAILAAPKRTCEVVTVENWGGEVHVWSISPARLSDFRRMMSPDDEKDTAWIVAACIGDESGPTMTPEDVPSIRDTRALPQVQLSAVAARLNGMTREEATKIAGE